MNLPNPVIKKKDYYQNIQILVINYFNVIKKIDILL